MSNLDYFSLACSEGPRIPRSLLLICVQHRCHDNDTYDSSCFVGWALAGGPIALIITAFVAGSRFYYDCFGLFK